MKYFLILILSLFFVSCSSDDSFDLVTPGTGSLGSLAFSKTCGGGSFSIYKEAAVLQSGYFELSNIPVGTSVSVRGTINSSECHSGSSVQFNCKGTMAIGTNRAVQCISGTVDGHYGNGPASTLNSTSFSTGASGPTDFLPNILNQQISPTCINPPCPSFPPSFSQPTPTFQSVNIINGQIHTFDNGTKAFVTITIPHPFNQGPCPISFTCN